MSHRALLLQVAFELISWKLPFTEDATETQGSEGTRPAEATAKPQLFFLSSTFSYPGLHPTRTLLGRGLCVTARLRQASGTRDFQASLSTVPVRSLSNDLEVERGRGSSSPCVLRAVYTQHNICLLFDFDGCKFIVNELSVH